MNGGAPIESKNQCISKTLKRLSLTHKIIRLTLYLHEACQLEVVVVVLEVALFALVQIIHPFGMLDKTADVETMIASNARERCGYMVISCQQSSVHDI